MNASESIPEQIGPYRVVRPVARGGMAAVYEVIEPDTGRHVALKLLERGFRGHHRFGREYRALTRLDHPNIVRVYRFGVSDDGVPFLTMELLDGVPAQVHAKRAGRPGTAVRVREAVRIVGEVARALAYLHGRGVVHRDLKSSNVLVLRDGRVKVLDFGTARLSDSAESITRHGEFVGTYAYAAPEQFNGGDVDARTDLYSLGVLFYRLLTGQRPFDSDSPEELRRMHTLEQARHPCEVVPGIPTEVGDVVMQLLRKVPDERPDSAGRVMEALVRFSGGAPGRAELPEPDLVGQSETVAELRQLIGDPIAAAGTASLVLGPPGSGAARVMRQVLTDARALGWTVLEDSLGSEPGLRSLAGLVRGVFRWTGVRADPELALVLSAVNRPAGGTPSESPDRLVRVLRRAFASRVGPTLLVLKNLEEASDFALSVLHSLLTTEVQMAVVAAANNDLPGLRQRLLGACPGLRCMPLHPLDRRGVSRLVGAVLGVRSPPPRMVERIHRATGGRPGFVVEVVHAMVAEGLAATPSVDLRAVDVSGGQVPLPEQVKDIVRHHYREFSTPAQWVLQALALANMPVSSSALEAASGTSGAEMFQVLRSLEEHHFVTPVAEGAAWELACGLYGSVILDLIRSTREEVLRRRLTAALVGAPPSPGLVRLLLDARSLPEASRVAVQWGEQLLADGRPDEVAPVLGRVVQSWEKSVSRRGCPGPVLLLHARALVALDPGGARAASSVQALRRRADVSPAAVSLLLARHLRWRPEGESGDEHLANAERVALESDEPSIWVEAALARHADAREAGRFDEAFGVLEQLRQRTRRAPDLDISAAIATAMSATELAAGRAAQAAAVVAPFIDNPRLSLHTRGCAAAAMGAALNAQGRWSEALDQVMGPILSEVRLEGCPLAHGALLLECAESRMALYQLGEARDLIEEMRAAGLRGLPPQRLRRSLLEGRLMLSSDSTSGAAGHLRSAYGAAQRFGLLLHAVRLGAWLGRALMEEGRFDEGLSVLDEVRNQAESVDSSDAAMEAALCRVEAIVCSRDAPQGVRSGALAEAEGIARLRAPVPRVRARVALVHSGALDGAALEAAISSANDALDALEQHLSAEATAALRIHPWRVQVERVSRGDSLRY